MLLHDEVQLLLLKNYSEKKKCIDWLVKKVLQDEVQWRFLLENDLNLILQQ